MIKKVKKSIIIEKWIVLAMSIVGVICLMKQHKETIRLKELAEKHLTLYLLMNQWVGIKQKEKKIEEYLFENGFRKIAIYGMNYVGKTLYNELRNSRISVVCGIDRNRTGEDLDIPVISGEEQIKQIMVDVVVVTPVFYYEDILDDLEEKIDCPIISMKDILDSVEKDGVK